MRTRWRALYGKKNGATGSWLLDAEKNPDFEDPEDMTAEQLALHVKALSRRVGPYLRPLDKEPDAVVWRVLEEVFGNRLDALFDFGTGYREGAEADF
jgi:hypothetical protein